MADYLKDMDFPPSESDEESLSDRASRNGESGDGHELTTNVSAEYFAYEAVQLDTSGELPLVTFVFRVVAPQGTLRLKSDLLLPACCKSAFEEPLDLAFGDGSTGHRLECALFHIGMVVLTWYWGLFGFEEIRIEAGYLDEDQVQWWSWFYCNAFAEWAVVVGQRCAPEPRLIACVPDSLRSGVQCCRRNNSGVGPRVLCPLGGGKDSLVAYRLMQEQQVDTEWLYVSDGDDEYWQNARLRGIVEMSGRPAHVAVHRFHREQLDLARRRGFSRYSRSAVGQPYCALVCFDAALVALAAGFDHAAVGCERSADSGNGVWLPRLISTTDSRAKSNVASIEVNHQWDKSWVFEVSFKSYLQKYVAEDFHYFSPLMPLWDLQVAALFSQLCHPYLQLFISCNELEDVDEEERWGINWCAQCDKCCFVFVVLAAFLGPNRVARKVFGGKNLLDDVELLPRFSNLARLGEASNDWGGQGKPFECVGTHEEVRLALFLCLGKCRDMQTFPRVLFELHDELQESGVHNQLQRIMEDWGHSENLPSWWNMSQTMQRWLSDASSEAMIVTGQGAEAK